MSTLEYCIARRKAERKAFVNVLKAVPQDRLEYRPDPKARSAAQIVWLLAQEEAALVALLDAGSILWKETPPPSSVAEMVAAHERSYDGVNERLAKLDEPGWQKKAAFVMEGMPTPWEDTVAEFVWGFLFDAIHHRGQLSTYLRPMGSRVPAIYGPSADDPGGQ
jgi:uncharacterized damage-inducible protein DinB